MNREIKFRVWNGDMMSQPFFPWEMVPDITGGWMDRDGVSIWWEESTAKWMQFTGLKDKAGVEIYEGDIVRHPTDGVFRIQWYCDRWEAYQEPSATAFDGRNLFSVNNILAVIGNIFEPPASPSKGEG